MLPTADRYQAYVNNSLLGSDPIGLVVALYDGAIEAARHARRCLETGDHWGRSTAVSKAGNILTELIISLDDEKGGALSQNLRQLYAYMHSRLVEGHVKKSAEIFSEVERLLATLLDAWRVVAAKSTQANEAFKESESSTFVSEAEDMVAMRYKGYLYGSVDTFSGAASAL